MKISQVYGQKLTQVAIGLAYLSISIFPAPQSVRANSSSDLVESFANLDSELVAEAKEGNNDSSEIEGEIRTFIKNWGKAWSPKEAAPQFSSESFAPFYLQSEELLAFDFTDSESQTVFRGVENHHQTWSAFVRDYDYWTFTPVTESIRIYPQSEDAAAATLYVDNYGKKPDGTEFKARAHATLLLEKHSGNWVIVHENIWGPVNE